MRRRVPEKTVQHHIASLLASVGGRVYIIGTRRPKGDYQGTRQTPGIPDLMAFLPNWRARAASNACQEEGWVSDADQTLLLFVEVKAAGGRLRPEQAQFKAHCMHAHVAHVVGGLDDVIAWLVEEGHLKPDNVPHYRLPAEARG